MAISIKNGIKNRLLLLVFSLLCFGFSSSAHALMILDEMVFIGPKSAAAIFKIKNPTEEPEAYRMGWTQFRMKPGGGKEKVPPGETIPGVMPAEPYMFMSPRRLMLMPDQLQHVRFMVRRMENMAPGEYRSYIVFQPELIPDEYKSGTGEQKAAPQGAASVQLNMLTGFQIPVFFLHGETTLETAITEAGYGKASNNQEGIYFTFTRVGNRSAIGDLEVRCELEDRMVRLGRARIQIFTEVPSRDYFIRVDEIPPGCTTAYLDYMPHAGDPDYTGAFVRMAEVPLQ